MKNLDIFQHTEYWVATKDVRSISSDEWPYNVYVCAKQCIAILTESKVHLYDLTGRSTDLLLCLSVGHPVVCVVSSTCVFLWRHTDDAVLDVYTPSNRIRCAAFSPDKSTVILVSDDYHVISLTVSLELIFSVKLNQDCFGCAAPIALGWGKKETQFHGSAGKDIALLKAQSFVLSAYDDGRFEIVWRDDGQYFCVSWPDTSNDQRRLRVFTESGELFSTSEPLNDLEPSLCWRPRIQFICGIQRRPQRGLDVIFFETNAQRHGEFELLDKTLESYFRVHQMRFDDSGDILAVLCTPIECQTGYSFVRLLTCSNFMWLLKRELTLKSCNSPNLFLPSMTWLSGSPQDGLVTLYVAHSGCSDAGEADVEGAIVCQWELSSGYASNCCLTDAPRCVVPDSCGTPGFVAVIDGDRVRLTALALSAIPPPMFATDLKVIASTAVDNVTSKIASVSFPGPWLDSRHPQHVPFLVQLQALSSRHSLLAIELGCGAPTTRHETFLCGDLSVECNWITGAQDAAPWPQSVHVIDLSSMFATTTLRNALNVEAALHACTTDFAVMTELNHFCWLTSSQFVFAADGGRLVGLVSVDLSSQSPDQNLGVACKSRWLLRTVASRVDQSDIHASLSAPHTRICGMCIAPDGLLCVQFMTGLVMVYDLRDLLASEDCLTVPILGMGIECSLVTVDSPANPIRTVIQLPAPCERIAVACFTSSESQHCSTPNHLPLNVSLPFQSLRSFLVALNKSTHRLYAAHIPNRDTRCTTTLPKTAGTLMDLCSSFIVLPNYLLATSMKKLLVCVPTQFTALTFTDDSACFKELVTQLNPSIDMNNTQNSPSCTWYDDYLHPIETGALLVTACPIDTSVVLQLPRGNLEVVYPRALVLTRLTNFLDSAKYTEALLLMRRHRVDLNLLYDHNPTLFRRNLRTFLQQVTNVELLTLFISAIVADDVSETMYGKFYSSATAQLQRSKLTQSHPKRTCGSIITSKENIVCDAMLDCMNGEKRFLLPALTCYAKKRPPEIHNALSLLSRYRASGDQTSWESGVRHLQYFTTPLELYRIALGTYDLELAQIMAQRTQLDPKEYLARLDELRSITGTDDSSGDKVEYNNAYQRFRIDDELLRYSSAVRHLRMAGPHRSDDVIAYTKSHQLFSEVIELYERDSAEFKAIAVSWAEHLLTRQKLVMAGNVYLRAGLLADAARTFLSTTQTHLWAIAVSLSNTSNHADTRLSNSEISEQAQKLATRLRDLGRYEEAIMLYSDYIRNPEMAMTTALDGGLWLEARRLASLHGLSSILQQRLKPKLLESHFVLLDQCQKVHEEFCRHFDRLMVLRNEQKNEAESRRVAQLLGNVDDVEDLSTESELFSDTSSLFDSTLSGSVGVPSLQSSGTRKSGRAKARRKEAQRWSCKPGSKYEEVGLIKALAQSVEMGQRIAHETPVHLLELWHCGLISEGFDLLREANQMLHEHKSSIPLIWDEWTTEKNSEITCSPQYDGRKRYPFKEPFLCYAPVMLTIQLDCDLLNPS